MQSSCAYVCHLFFIHGIHFTVFEVIRSYDLGIKSEGGQLNEGIAKLYFFQNLYWYYVVLSRVKNSEIE